MEEIIKHALLWNVPMMVFLLMCLNSTVSAPPSELIISFGAFITAASGTSIFVEVFLPAFAGNLFGIIAIYCLGRSLSNYWDKRVDSLLGSKLSLLFRVLQIYTNRARENDTLWVFYSRSLPVVRSISSLPAGLAKMPFLQYVSLSTFGIIIWISIWSTIGALFFEIYVRYETVFLGLPVAVVACVLLKLKSRVKTKM